VPETHPFWTSKEENHWDVIPKVKALKHPGHIMRYLTHYLLPINPNLNPPPPQN
jgi:hypothetical protein